LMNGKGVSITQSSSLGSQRHCSACYVHEYGIENVPAADTVLVANFDSFGLSWQTHRR
jgi:hypothetical protein